MLVILIDFFNTTGGFISKHINRQLIAIGSLMGLAMSICLTPYCPTTALFFVAGGGLAFFSGCYDSSQMVWIIEIWQQKAGPFIQAQHFCFAIGAIIGPAIVAPFLSKADHSNVHTTESPSTEESKIHIPFLIIGALNTVALAFQLFLFTFYRYHTPPMYANENFELIDDAKNIPSPMETDLSGTVSINQQESVNVMGVSHRKIKLIVFTVVFLGSYQAMEVSTMQFLPMFGQYSDLKMTESAAAYVLTGMMGTFAIGRLIGIIITMKVRPELIILTNFILIVAANSILLVWANSNLTMFWIGSCILGAGYSTTFPSFCAFIEKYLVFSSTVASYIIFVSTVMSPMYPFIVGKFIAQHAVVLAYMNFFSLIVCVGVMGWGYRLTRKSVDRER